MFILATFDTIKPELGLIVWTVIIFSIFWFLMRNFAFRPIIDALETREDNIHSAMAAAEEARKEMESYKDENAKILGEARAEQASIMKEARAVKNQVIEEAKTKAKAEANQVIVSALTEINAEKTAALTELKKDSGSFALAIAEKVMDKKLKGDDNEGFANGLIDNINLN
ncbi:MAG TPA: ATP synthase F0 subunit B [Phaeodactylibacter sp.]|nr:ATP synthase F0 subunit B [Phaeodactylibacter sp.]